MKSIRSLVVAILLVAAFSCVAIALGKTKKPLTPAQRKAANRCIEVYMDAVNNCLNTHPYLSTGDCSKMEETIYQDCMQRAGLAREDLPPPKVNPRGGTTGKPSDVKQPSATPRAKPLRTPDGSVPAVSSGEPSATPRTRPLRTPDASVTSVSSAKSSPTPSPSPKKHRSPGDR